MFYIFPIFCIGSRCMYSLAVRQSHTLQCSPPYFQYPTGSCIVITILLIVFPMLYFTYAWLFYFIHVFKSFMQGHLSCITYWCWLNGFVPTPNTTSPSSQEHSRANRWDCRIRGETHVVLEWSGSRIAPGRQRLRNLSEESEVRRWIYATFYISACGYYFTFWQKVILCNEPVSSLLHPPYLTCLWFLFSSSISLSIVVPSFRGWTGTHPWGSWVIPQCCFFLPFGPSISPPFFPSGRLSSQGLLPASCLFPLPIPSWVTVLPPPHDFHTSTGEQMNLKPGPK